MSRRGNVRNPQRNQKQMQVFVASRNLMEYTFKITNNAKRFKKKWRFTLTDKIQNSVLEIYENLVMANETYVRCQRTKEVRIAYQKKVLAKVKILAEYVELSYSLGIIKPASFEYWGKLMSDVRRLTAAWFNQTNKN